MASGDDEDSPTASSDNDVDETMEDLDEGEAEAGGDIDAEADNEDDNEENDDEEDPDETQDNVEETPTRPHARVHKTSRPQSNVRTSTLNGLRNEPSGHNDGRDPHSRRLFPSDDSRRSSFTPQQTAPVSSNKFKPGMRQEAVNAILYDIAPTIAAPHSTSINTIAATPDMRWVFSGGSDGWVRKFNWIDTANGKSMLTVAQRHPFVDSVTKAGVLMSYWENEDTLGAAAQGTDEGVSLSPVYSLAVHHQALWLLSGTELGAINLQSVRHDEGKRITSLYKHTSAVSVMSLSYDELSVLSGSWDKTIQDWDLNTGQVKSSFLGSGSQISAIEIRPISDVPIPKEVVENVPHSMMNGTFSANLDPKPSMLNGISATGNGIHSEGGLGSPNDSIFGGNEDNDSLFGDDDGGGGGEHNFNGDDDDEFAKALASGIQEQNQRDSDGDLKMNDQSQPPDFFGLPSAENPQSGNEAANTANLTPNPYVNGLPHVEEVEDAPRSFGFSETQAELPPMSESTFLDAAIDGTLRIWDRRSPNPVARLAPPEKVPPWCMHACWSPDGNFIYAGRRNGTVDEYSIHKGLREPRRQLRFPGGSGAVSALRAMPNGRHLVCASHDILRLYDLKDEESAKPSTVPFLIVPGHRTGVVSQLYIDPTCSFMISTGGNRGWEGNSTEVLLGYEIGIGR